MIIRVFRMVIINCQLSIINYFIERCHQLGNDERLSFHFVDWYGVKLSIFMRR